MRDGAWGLVVIGYAVVISALAIWGLSWFLRWRNRG